MHKRKQLRDRVHHILCELDYSVFSNRIHKLSDEQAPALMIYLSDEEPLEGVNQKQYTGIIDVELRIECVAKVNDSFSDVLDQMLFDVQEVMTAERSSEELDSLSNLSIGYMYGGLEEVGAEAGELDVGSQTIIYTIHYEQEL